MKGFCYVTHQEMTQIKAYWVQRLREAIAAGGFRRVEGGETFLHAPDPIKGRFAIKAEVYANINLPENEEPPT